MNELWSRIKVGAGWTGVAIVCGRVISWSSTLVVAAILGPSAFGLVTLGWLLTFTFTTLRDEAASVAVLSGDGERSGERAWWWLMVGFSLIGTSLFILSESLAHNWTEEEPNHLFLALGLSVMVSGLSAVPSGVLQRELRFRALAIAQLVSIVVYAILAVAGTLNGLGPSSVGYAQLVGASTGVVIVLVLTRFNPVGAIRVSAIPGASSAVLATMVWAAAGMAFLNADTIVVAHVLGGDDLGRYALAFNMSYVATLSVALVVARVLFPAFRLALPDARPKLYLSTLRAVLVVTLPLTLALVTAGPALFVGVFGQDYAVASTVVPILAVYGIVAAVASVPMSALRAVGRHWFVASILIAQSGISIVLGIPATERFGIIGAATAVSLAALAGGLTLLRAAGESLEMPPIDQLATFPRIRMVLYFLPAIGASLVGAGSAAIALAVVGLSLSWTEVRSQFGTSEAIEPTDPLAAENAARSTVWDT